MRAVQIELGLDQITEEHAKAILLSDLSNYRHVQDLQFSAAALSAAFRRLSTLCDSADLQVAINDVANALKNLGVYAGAEVGRLTNR